MQDERVWIVVLLIVLAAAFQGCLGHGKTQSTVPIVSSRTSLTESTIQPSISGGSSHRSDENITLVYYNISTPQGNLELIGVEIGDLENLSLGEIEDVKFDGDPVNYSSPLMGMPFCWKIHRVSNVKDAVDYLRMNHTVTVNYRNHTNHTYTIWISNETIQSFIEFLKEDSITTTPQRIVVRKPPNFRVTGVYFYNITSGQSWAVLGDNLFQVYANVLPEFYFTSEVYFLNLIKGKPAVAKEDGIRLYKAIQPLSPDFIERAQKGEIPEITSWDEITAGEYYLFVPLEELVMVYQIEIYDPITFLFGFYDGYAPVQWQRAKVRGSSGLVPIYVSNSTLKKPVDGYTIVRVRMGKRRIKFAYFMRVFNGNLDQNTRPVIYRVNLMYGQSSATILAASRILNYTSLLSPDSYRNMEVLSYLLQNTDLYCNPCWTGGITRLSNIYLVFGSQEDLLYYPGRNIERVNLNVTIDSAEFSGDTLDVKMRLPSGFYIIATQGLHNYKVVNARAYLLPDFGFRVYTILYNPVEIRVKAKDAGDIGLIYAPSGNFTRANNLVLSLEQLLHPFFSSG